MNELIKAAIFGLKVSISAGLITTIALFAGMAPFLIFEGATLYGITVIAGLTGWILFLLAFVTVSLVIYLDT